MNECKEKTRESYLIDLSNSNSAVDLILKLGNRLELGEYRFKNKQIMLNLGDLTLSNSNILSIKSIVESFESEISIIYSNSSQTQMSVISAGLSVSDEDITIVDAVETVEIVENEEDDEVEHPENVCHSELDNMVQTCEAEIHDSFPTLSALREQVRDNNSSSANLPTFYVQQTLRSGQSITYDGNVVIIGDCNAGSEIIASGDITVWGILNGIAHAGAKGDELSKIRALKMNAIQLRISGFFARRPDKLKFEKVEKLSAFIPEEARITDGEIIIYTINQ